MPGATPASPGIAAERAAAAAAAGEGGTPSTEDPMPEVMLKRLGGVGRRGAV